MDLKQEVEQLLYNRCSSLCLDDDEDRQRCAEVVTEFILKREIRKKDEERRSTK